MSFKKHTFQFRLCIWITCVSIVILNLWATSQYLYTRTRAQPSRSLPADASKFNNHTHPTNHTHHSHHTNHTNASFQPNNSHIRIPDKMYPKLLDLAPEETASIRSWSGFNSTQSGQTCNYPVVPILPNENKHKFRSSRCCIGASTAGAEQKYDNLKRQCHQTIQDLNQVRDYAMEELNHAPLLHPNPLLHCDICRIVQIAASLPHQQISFVGDSIQNQVWTGFECELHRRGFHVLELHSQPWEELPAPPNRVAWKYGIKHEFCYNVTIPTWMADLEPNKHLSSSVRVCYYSHYRPHMDMKQHLSIAETSDVMIINYGAHYLIRKQIELEEFKASIQALLHAFQNVTNCELIYRETSAQHFNNEYRGEFISTKDSEGCTEHRGSAIRRKHIFEKVAAANNYRVVDAYGRVQGTNVSQGESLDQYEITFLPLFDFTTKLHNMHSSEADCSHFCYTPSLWYPTWRHLRITMDRILG